MAQAVQKRERLFEIITGALVALGLPLAFGIPETLDAKVYALSALLLGAAIAGAAAVAFLRRPNRPFSESMPASAGMPRSDSAREGAPRKPAAYSELSRLDTGKWNLELVKRLEWRRFEELCAAYFQTLGFKAETTRIGADGAADIDLYAEGSESRSIIVQCKGWDTITVGINAVRALRGMMKSENIPEGVFITSGKFTQAARDVAAKESIDLIDGAELLRKIGALTPEQSDALLKMATQDEFLTPTCPSCATKMTARSSTPNGRKYWGCRSYPKCKQTFFSATNAPV